jgi:hypothetical protein
VIQIGRRLKNIQTWSLLFSFQVKQFQPAFCLTLTGGQLVKQADRAKFIKGRRHAQGNLSQIFRF